MRIALTGGTGFIGRYIIRQLATDGHELVCWHREDSNRSGLEDCEGAIEWRLGTLGNADDARALVSDCEAVVHAALYHPQGGFMGGEGDLLDFAEKNLMGTLQLFEAAADAELQRFVFVSTCAVHDRILEDRPLDETHPLWPFSHYGAHKAALEKFVHSYGLGRGFPICALRPTGVYGLNTPPAHSKWFELVESVVRGEPVTCARGGKEVHAADVARAASLLLNADADAITGQAFNCYDLYVSEWDVALLAREISGSRGAIHGQQTIPKHQIATDRIRNLGMTFGGRTQLETTIRQLVEAVG
ncbi:3 beta-hydroxysteroid dehydrogenase/Delta 5--_4-isomerase [Maioricimonas rarisocia]|uniref:3 beta-hydroxysteroid dehydrogenase/Delta 5-->4-isomerase n=1 Tax=Maioricimonas rarisocia TaxID=2528026 RepID=A0A517ZF61_9PLAN|nr:NAD(P)-dependent oxidoreductase [Maioricimonas rarisocia]QDU41096.1 3 beta-hydroxysteroid dehydrogenase/Delta 5-->4-isomerase [Maioricimonas rarisocia]